MSQLTLKDIKQAQERIQGIVNKTPVIQSRLLNSWLGHEIFFKVEAFQKIGAFKSRGACNTIAWLLENNIRPKHIISNSSGNHAQAVAWAAGRYGIPSTIFMPKYASSIKIQATRSLGAQVDLSEDRNMVDLRVSIASQEKDTYWIHPFNHEQVICGQGTAAFEAIHEISGLDCIAAPCGGGGLLSGTLIATRGLSSKTKVIGAEPLNANDAAISLRNNSIHKLTSVPDTLADGAMTMSVGTLTFEYLKQLDEFYEIEEEKIIYWTQWLSHLLKVVVEPTSALAMEAATQWLSIQKSKRRIMIILSGGNIDRENYLKIWQKNLLDRIPMI
jgi:threo-3-hydroxy-L-aspartate ammonia-lyase